MHCMYKKYSKTFEMFSWLICLCDKRRSALKTVIRLINQGVDYDYQPSWASVGRAMSNSVIVKTSTALNVTTRGSTVIC